MADTTLAQLSSRVLVQLSDSSQKIYTTAAVTEAIRQAVNEYGAATGTAVTVKDLDTAVATTLPVLYEGLIVLGAVAFAIGTRAIERADSFQAGELPSDLADHSQEQLKIFRALLGDLAGDSMEAVNSAKVAAETTKLMAEANQIDAEVAAAAAKAALIAAEKITEAARLAGLHGATVPPWSTEDTWDNPDPTFEG